MEKTLVLLKKLSHKYPPDEMRRHNITVSMKGALIVTISYGGTWWPIIITPDMLGLTVDELLVEIDNLMQYLKG